MDPDGERFAITVYGCTDNSIMTNYPFTEKFSKTFDFLNIEGQAIKYLNKEEIKILSSRDIEYRECSSEYHKESERMEQDILLGKMGNKSSKDVKPKNGATRSEPTKPTYVMGQSSSQYSPNFSYVKCVPNQIGDMKFDDNVIGSNNVVPDGASYHSSSGSSSSRGVTEGRKSNRRSDNYKSQGNDEDVDVCHYDNWKSGVCHYIQDEAFMLLTWLNKFVCKKMFSPENFPECVIDNNGDVFIDFIEQVT